MENARTENSAACGQSRSTVVLERCPFCGGEAAFGKVTYAKSMVREQGWTQDTFHSVNCVSCGSCNQGLVGYKTPEEAADHWNQRPGVLAEREACAQACEPLSEHQVQEARRWAALTKAETRDFHGR